MKKLFSSALALAMGLTCAGALTACDNGNEQAPKDAISALKAMYVEELSSTPGDYDVIGQYVIDGVPYKIDWSVILPDGVTEGVTVGEMNETTKMVTIDVSERPATELVYTLKATVTSGKYSESVEFKNIKVPAFIVNTHAEYLANEKGTSFVAVGVVTGFAKDKDGASKNCIYLQDNDGGYYAYSVTTLPEGLAIGDEISVTGTLDEYSGARQLTNTAVSILTKNKGAVAPKDITDIVKAATSTKDKALTDLAQSLVTIKGALLCSVSTDTSYFDFKVGNLNCYLRISSSDCPTGATNQAAIKKAHADNLGKTATVTGVVTLYSGAFYLVPVGGDAFKDFAENTATAEEKIAAEKEAATLITSFTGNGEIALPAPSTFTDVTFAWASDNAAVVVGDGKLTVTAPEAAVDVKITLTLTCGDKTDTKEFTLKVNPAPKVSMAGTYIMKLQQAKLDNKVLYFTGVPDGNYGATSETASDAAKVVVAEVEGGYTLKAGDNFIEVASYDNKGKTSYKVSFVGTATGVWTYDYTLKLFTYALDEKVFYLGTYNTFKTISPSETYRISGDKASEVGVSQFPVQYVATSAKLDFSTITDTAGKAISDDGALAFFNGYISSGIQLTSVEVKNVYPGTGDGGAKPKTAGILKMGKSKDTTKLVLNFSQDIVKIEVKCHDFYKVSDQYPTTSNKVTINGVEKASPYNATGDGEVLTVELETATKAVTIESASRLYVYEIVVYFAD